MTITEELPNTTMRAAETLKKRALVHDDIDLEKHSNMEATKCSVWEDLTGLASVSIVIMSIHVKYHQQGRSLYDNLKKDFQNSSKLCEVLFKKSESPCLRLRFLKSHFPL